MLSCQCFVKEHFSSSQSVLKKSSGISWYFYFWLALCGVLVSDKVHTFVRYLRFTLEILKEVFCLHSLPAFVARARSRCGRFHCRERLQSFGGSPTLIGSASLSPHCIATSNKCIAANSFLLLVAMHLLLMATCINYIYIYIPDDRFGHFVTLGSQNVQHVLPG